MRVNYRNDTVPVLKEIVTRQHELFWKPCYFAEKFQNKSFGVFFQMDV